MKTVKKIFSFFILSVIIVLGPCSACSYNSLTRQSDIDTYRAVSSGINSYEHETTVNDPDPVSVTLMMAGDLLLHRFVQISGKKADGSYDYNPVFENVREEISSADIAIVNQETPLAGDAFGLSGYPFFNAPCEFADAIAWAGFDVVLQATNHALDQGKSGLIAGRAYWSENFPEIKIAGTALSEEEAAGVCVVECSGISIAVLNYTYGTNGIPLPSGMPWIVSMLDESKIRADIARAKGVSDFIVVCPHWGIEYAHSPSSSQRTWCDLFFECGADLIIGTHPHVIQPIEWYEDAAGRKMLVYWSLGNFVNSTAETGYGVSNRMMGGMAKVMLTRGADGKIYISQANVVPVVTQLNEGYGGVTVYPFCNYNADLAQKNLLVRERDPQFSYENCKKVFKEIFGEYYN